MNSNVVLHEMYVNYKISKYQIILKRRGTKHDMVLILRFHSNNDLRFLNIIKGSNFISQRKINVLSNDHYGLSTGGTRK